MGSGHIILDATVIALNFGTVLTQLASVVVAIAVAAAVAVALFVNLNFGANPGNLLSDIPSAAPVR